MTVEPNREELYRKISELEKEVSHVRQMLKQHQDELRVHSVIFDAVPAMIFFKDNKNRMLRVNSALAEATSMRKEEIEGKSAFDFAFSREQAAAYWRDDLEVMRSGQARRNILEPLVTDKTRWYRTDKVPYMDKAGNAIGVIGFSVDVTDLKMAQEALEKAGYQLERRLEDGAFELKTANERRQEEVKVRERAEEALRRSEARLITAIESLPFDFFVIDESGQYVLQNSTCREHWGDLIGKRPEDVAPDHETLSLWKSNNRRVLTGEVVKDEVCFSFRGEKRCFLNIISPIFNDGRVEGILGINFDITDRKKAEEALQKANEKLEERVLERTRDLSKANERLKQEIAIRQTVLRELKQSRERYRAVFEGANQGILLADAQEREIRLANPAACQFLGYSEEEILGMSIEKLHPEEQLGHVITEFDSLVRDVKRETKDIPFLRKDATVRYADVSAVPILIGEKDHAVGFLRDITEQKLAQQALRKREEQLEQRARDLEEANIALEVLLRKREEDQKTLEQTMLLNVQNLVLPYVEKLKNAMNDASHLSYLSILESGLNEITSPFLRTLSSQYLILTPTELRVADLVREGMTTKEIAQILNATTRAIDFHRNNLRRKLGLKDRKTNLRTYLMTLA
jgi:PAS domain S-box-containing protein